MSDPVEVELGFELGERSVSFDLHEELYPKAAVYGAAYLFVERAWLFLTRPSDGTIRVQIRTRDEATTDELMALAGEFANELLNQVVRTQISEKTASLREYTLARAFFGGEARVSIDALLAELDAEELDDDPLEIEVPWDNAGGPGA